MVTGILLCEIVQTLAQLSVTASQRTTNAAGYNQTKPAQIKKAKSDAQWSPTTNPEIYKQAIT